MQKSGMNTLKIVNADMHWRFLIDAVFWKSNFPERFRADKFVLQSKFGPALKSCSKNHSNLKSQTLRLPKSEL